MHSARTHAAAAAASAWLACFRWRWLLLAMLCLVCPTSLLQSPLVSAQTILTIEPRAVAAGWQNITLVGLSYGPTLAVHSTPVTFGYLGTTTFPFNCQGAVVSGNVVSCYCTFVAGYTYVFSINFAGSVASAVSSAAPGTLTAYSTLSRIYAADMVGPGSNQTVATFAAKSYRSILMPDYFMTGAAAGTNIIIRTVGRGDADLQTQGFGLAVNVPGTNDAAYFPISFTPLTYNSNNLVYPAAVTTYQNSNLWSDPVDFCLSAPSGGGPVFNLTLTLHTAGSNMPPYWALMTGLSANVSYMVLDTTDPNAQSNTNWATESSLVHYTTVIPGTPQIFVTAPRTCSPPTVTAISTQSQGGGIPFDGQAHTITITGTNLAASGSAFNISFSTGS